MQCRDKVQTVVVDNPIEECDMEPIRTCKWECNTLPVQIASNYFSGKKPSWSHVWLRARNVWMFQRKFVLGPRSTQGGWGGRRSRDGATREIEIRLRPLWAWRRSEEGFNWCMRKNTLKTVIVCIEWINNVEQKLDSNNWQICALDSATLHLPTDWQTTWLAKKICFAS